MNPPKAIETLNDLLFHNPDYFLDRRGKAIKLGIEALKFIEQLRTSIPHGQEHLLPGETEE